MTLPAVRQDGPKPSPTTEERAERIKRVLDGVTAHNTREAQSNDLRGLARWQEAQGLRAGLPVSPQEFLAWLDYLANEAGDPRRGTTGLTAATVARKASSVSIAHKRLGYDSPIDNPIVADYLRGLPRVSDPQRHARPLRIEQLFAVMVELADRERERNRTLAARDKAILLLGFHAALRRSELCGLLVEDFELAPKGAAVHLRRSKTDQAGQGYAVPIYRRALWCPVRAVCDWLALRAELSGAAIGGGAPLFVGVDKDGGLRDSAKQAPRTLPRTIDKIVKDRCEAAGLLGYSAHSLRAGYCVSAREAGASEFSIRRVTRHRSVATLHRYFDGSALFDDDVFSALDAQER